MEETEKQLNFLYMKKLQSFEEDNFILKWIQSKNFVNIFDEHNPLLN